MGGIHPSNKSMQNLFLLNLNNLTWQEISAPNEFNLKNPISNFTTLKYSRNKLINFGGILSAASPGHQMTKDLELLSDINILNIESKKWLNDVKLFDERKPDGISGHASCIVERKMYVFGGEMRTDLVNELWCLDLDIMAWSRIEAHGDLPCPRSYSAIISSTDNNRY